MKPGGQVKPVPLKINTNVPKVKEAPKALRKSVFRLRTFISLSRQADAYQARIDRNYYGAALRVRSAVFYKLAGKRGSIAGLSGKTNIVTIVLSKLPKALQTKYRKFLGKGGATAKTLTFVVNIKTVGKKKIYRFAQTVGQLTGKKFKAVAGIPKASVLQAKDNKQFGKLLRNIYHIDKPVITHSTIRKSIKDPKKQATFAKRLISAGWRYVPKSKVDPKVTMAIMPGQSYYKPNAQFERYLGNDGIWIVPK